MRRLVHKWDFLLGVVLTLGIVASLAWQNVYNPGGSGGSAALGAFGMPSMPSLKVGAVLNQTIGSGNVDLGAPYIVPAGKRATIVYTFTNLTGGSINATNEVKIGGVYYQVGALAAVGNNTTGQQAAGFNTYPILEAGDSFSVLTSASGLQVFGWIFEYSTSEPLSSPRITGLTSGDQTIFTCPTSPASRCYVMNAAGNNCVLRIFNATAGTRTYTWNAVPNGGSVSTGNRIFNPFTLATLTNSNLTSGCPAFGPGDFLNINSDSALAGQFAYVPNMVTIPQ